MSVDDAAQRMEQSGEKRGYGRLTRDELHRLVDAIPDGELAAAAAALDPFIDPVTRALMLAPEDDEPLTDDERGLIEAARTEADAVGYIPYDEVKRRHGLM